MNILASFKVSAVTPVRERAGDGIGPIRLALTMESELNSNIVAAMLPTASNQAAFAKKYWAEDGTLLIADLSDAVSLAREIIGGNVTIVAGGGFSKPMTFEEADVKNIRFIPEPGHKGKLKLAVHVRPADDEDCGRLVNMHSTEITLTAARSKADSEREAREKLAADAQGDLLKSREVQHEDGPTLDESLEQARRDVDTEGRNPGVLNKMREMEKEDIQRQASSSDKPAPRTPGQRQAPKSAH